MDFLRIESESNFLLLLPEDTRATQRERWYRETNHACASFVELARRSDGIMSGVTYKTSDHKRELYAQITEMMSPVLSHRHSIDQIGDVSIKAGLQRLSNFNGVNTRFLPEVSVIQLVTDNPDESQLGSIVRNNAHTNIVSLFSERKRLLPEENTITVARGVIGSYPNVFLRVHSNNI